MAQFETRKAVAVQRLATPARKLEALAAAGIILTMITIFFVVQPKAADERFGNAAQALLDFREEVENTSTAERIGQVTSKAGPADVLQVLGASEVEAKAAVEALKKTGLLNLKKLKAGTALTAHFDESGEDAVPRLIAVSLKTDPAQTLMATRNAEDGFHGSILTARLNTTHKRLAGTIDTTLSSAIRAAGGEDKHARQFSALFQEDPQLVRGGRKGERFDLIYEVAVDERGNEIQTGDVVFAAFNGYRTAGSWYRHVPGDTNLPEFYNVNGIARARFLTRYPVGRVPVNSGFGQRYHPVTGQLHLHSGVDFKAAEGTPIYAAGDGVVKVAADRSGYGNMVQLDHARGYQTIYAHMSRFADNLKAGQRVLRGDLIGYVGNTGTATGAHLHYEIREHGRLVNPMTIELPSGRDLSAQPELFAEFLVRRSELDAFRGATVPALVAEDESSSGVIAAP